MKIYLAELDRFGYILRVVSKTRANAVNALMNEYFSAYESRNDGEEPSPEEVNSARNDIGIVALDFDEVDWD